jgi:hypothetical protein
MDNEYTVTLTGTYFVTASNYDDALDKVYEAMLGNDKQSLLGWGEVHLDDAKVQEGTHRTISYD